MLVFKFRTQSFSTLPSSVFIEENLFLQTLPIFCETTRLSLIMWISSKTTASLITEGEEGEVECWQWKQCLWSVPAPPQRRGYLTSPFKCSKASPPALLGTAFPHGSGGRRQFLYKGVWVFLLFFKSQITPLPNKIYCIFNYSVHQYSVFVALYVKAKKSDGDSAVLQLLREKLEETWKIRAGVWLGECGAEIHCRYIITTHNKLGQF